MAYVECQADLFRPIALEPGLHLGGLLDGSAADDDAVDAIAQQVVDDSGGPHTAADLDLQRLLRGETDDDTAIRELPVLGAIEVDHVQPAGPQRTITLQQFVWLEVIAR